MFGNSVELLFGSILIYHFRLLERIWSTPKFVSFGLFTTIFSAIVQSFILTFGKSITGRIASASGPYPFLFAALYVYYKNIPHTQHFRVGGFTLNDKSFVYTLAIQVLY
jgi:hypothetical protein